MRAVLLLAAAVTVLVLTGREQVPSIAESQSAAAGASDAHNPAGAPRGRHGAGERAWRRRSAASRHRRCSSRPRPGGRWCPAERQAEEREALVGPLRARLDRIAWCESRGNPRAVSSGGTYRGRYQFDAGTWASVGGVGDPAAASMAEQEYRAALLYLARGAAPWPVCGYR